MEEVDRILRDILSGDQRTKEIDAMFDCDSKLEIDSDDLAFIQKMIDSCRVGSQVVFVALHPNDHMQYIIIGGSRLHAVDLMAKMISRLTNCNR